MSHKEATWLNVTIDLIVEFIYLDVDVVER